MTSASQRKRSLRPSPTPGTNPRCSPTRRCSVECCSTEETPSRDGRSCPVCGEVGRRVQTVTLDALVRDDVPRNDEVYRFCGVSGCKVAWFGEQTGHLIPVRASRVRIGQKESSFDRPLCYCFGYRHSDLVEDLGAHGRSTIPATIAA